LRELAGTLAAEARGGRSSVFFPTIELLTQPGMSYLLARQHLGPGQISLATRVLEENLGDYLADIRHADVVIVSDSGPGLLPHNMPSEKVQGPLLQYMRENSAFRLARQIGGPNEKSFYVFERDRPIREGMSVEALEPVSGAGSSQTFRLVVSHADGHRNFNGALLRFLGPGGQQCLIDYNHKNEAWIVSRGAAWSEELPAGKPGLLESSTCALDGATSSVEKSGTQLVLRFAIRFQPAFAGSHQISAYAENKQGKGTGWIPLGEWKSE
ncbi:MAG TPA: hypothetical protein VG672_14895, partial [Bryobacteraceae bacterium]|nr:hypothetical protein [Bryobacteraceae bacterium]